MIVFHYDPATFPKGTMIKQTPIGSTATHEMALTLPIPFPSPPLIFLNIISCLLATAAFGAALAQIDSYLPFVTGILPSSIGFLATVPFHLFLYILARKHTQAVRKGLLGDTDLFPMWAFVYIFLLVTLWLVILIIDILCCANMATAGIVITTIFAGCECIVSALLALKCVLESWEAEGLSKNFGNGEIPSDTDPEGAVISDDETLDSYVI